MHLLGWECVETSTVVQIFASWRVQQDAQRRVGRRTMCFPVDSTVWISVTRSEPPVRRKGPGRSLNPRTVRVQGPLGWGWRTLTTISLRISRETPRCFGVTTSNRASGTIWIDRKRMP